MSQTHELLKRVAAKAGYTRARFTEKNIPEDPSNITAFYHFGDVRSTFTLSSLLLKRFREEMKGSRYFILCSWPGYESLFPYVDEYWGLKDEAAMRTLYYSARGFDNNQDATKKFVWDLNWSFTDVMDCRNLLQFYDYGITQGFFDRFRHVKRTLPLVPSAAILGDALSQSFMDRSIKKVFVYPNSYINVWQRGKIEPVRCPEEFWLSLINRLLEDGYMPVVGYDYLTHSLAGKLDEKCLYIPARDINLLMAAMRHCDVVLDVFFGNSRLAMAARAPFVACDERARYYAQKEYEVDDLCCEQTLPRRYLFSFPIRVLEGNESGIVDCILSRVKEIVGIDRNTLPSTSESTIIIPYTNVRRLRNKHLGTKLIKRK